LKIRNVLWFEGMEFSCKSLEDTLVEKYFGLKVRGFAARI
jgi:hypothetical protein